jgi:hypothetical protein
MTFAELPGGAKFRFFRRGLLLTKASKNTYTALAGHAQKAAPDAELLPEKEDGRLSWLQALARRASPRNGLDMRHRDGGAEVGDGPLASRAHARRVGCRSVLYQRQRAIVV